MTAVGRLDDFSGYVDPADPDLEYDSITTVLSSTRRTVWIERWASKLAATYAVENLTLVANTLIHAEKADAVALIARAAQREREVKSEVGVFAHDVFEALLLDGPIPNPPVHLLTAHIDGEPIDWDAICDGLQTFLIDHPIEPLLSEATVCHSMQGLAGTLDMLARFPWSPDGAAGGSTGLIDLKTGKRLDQQVPAQLAGYRHCREVWLPFGRKIAMPRVDWTGVLHLRREFPRGYRLQEIPTGPAEWEELCRAHAVYRDHQQSRKVLGRYLYPPLPDGSQPLPPVPDVDELGRYRAPLTSAGIGTLYQLAALTPTDLLTIKGVGPSALPTIAAVLAAHDLPTPAAPGRTTAA